MPTGAATRQSSRSAARQRLAVAHFDAERAIERCYAGLDGAKRLYTVDAVLDIHRELFAPPPVGDLDGRGNLSEQALISWIDYVLDICLDQVQFMAATLNLSAMEQRIAACLIFEEQSLRSGVRRESLRPLHYLYSTGAELERGEFKSMMALGDRTAVSALAALLKRGLLKSDTPQGKVRFALPLHALRFYFPALWPEAEADPG